VRATEVEVLQATTRAFTSRRTSASSAWTLKRRTSSSVRIAVWGAGVVAEVDGRLERQPAQDLAQDRQAADSGVEYADGTWVGHGLSVSPERRPCGRPIIAAPHSAHVPADRRIGAGDHEGHAFVVGLDDQAPVRHDFEVGPPTQRPGQLVAADAAARVRSVDQVVDLLGV
jgi:hypothetical protein